MKKFCRCWDDETNGWLVSHAGMPRREMYRLFLKEHPGTDITETAFDNQRSRLGISPHVSHRSSRIRPVGSLTEKKGYVMEKVGYPGVWRHKHHIEWERAHPGETVDSRRHIVMFLDMDKRNFGPENLYRTERRVMLRINSGKFGHLTPGDPERNLKLILMAELEKTMFDRATEAGLTLNVGQSRRIRKHFLKKRSDYHRQRWRNDPDYRQRILERAHRRHELLTEEQRNRERVYKREWARKKKERERNGEN